MLPDFIYDIESIKLPPDQEIKELIKKLLKDPTIFHPRSLIFRPMRIDKIKALALDIKLNGLVNITNLYRL